MVPVGLVTSWVRPLRKKGCTLLRVSKTSVMATVITSANFICRKITLGRL